MLSLPGVFIGFPGSCASLLRADSGHCCQPEFVRLQIRDALVHSDTRANKGWAPTKGSFVDRSVQQVLLLVPIVVPDRKVVASAVYGGASDKAMNPSNNRRVAWVQLVAWDFRFGGCSVIQRKRQSNDGAQTDGFTLIASRQPRTASSVFELTLTPCSEGNDSPPEFACQLQSIRQQMQMTLILRISAVLPRYRNRTPLRPPTAIAF
eukprot:2156939-Rhodomonas_salina.1